MPTATPETDPRFWICLDPENPPSRQRFGLADEEAGGIIAYADLEFTAELMLTACTSIPSEAATAEVEFRVPQEAHVRPYEGDRLLVVEGCVVVELRPVTDGGPFDELDYCRYVAKVRGWHHGLTLFTGATPEEAVLRALGLTSSPNHD